MTRRIQDEAKGRSTKNSSVVPAETDSDAAVSLPSDVARAVQEQDKGREQQDEQSDCANVDHDNDEISEIKKQIEAHENRMAKLREEIDIIKGESKELNAILVAWQDETTRSQLLSNSRNNCVTGITKLFSLEQQETKLWERLLVKETSLEDHKRAFLRNEDENAALRSRIEKLSHINHQPVVKQPRYSWNSWSKPSPSPLHKMDSGSKTFEFDAAFLADFPLASRGKRSILYCRGAFHDQMTFLHEKVVKESHVGCILGPPGAGKSLTALAFASMLDHKEWTVTWIRLSHRNIPFCVRIQQGSRCTRDLESSDYHHELGEILYRELDENTKHIVFLDAMTTEHVKDEQICVRWRKQNKTCRRLVMVSSMSSRWKVKLHEDIEDEIEEFEIHSWTLSEYREAIESDAFFNNIQCNLDSSYVQRLGSMTSDAKSELVESKFYFAGGSARFMFDFTTGHVIKELDKSIAATSDALKHSTGEVGFRSNGVINRLFGSYIGGGGQERVVVPVSQHAASALATFGGPTLIKNVASILHQYWNPAIDGWVLEMLFFAKLRYGGVDLYDSNGNQTIRWLEAEVHRFDPCDKNTFSFSSSNMGVWLKPIKWNQGGYDGVFLNQKERVVRFIQVTRSETHSLKLEYFHSFLKMLGQSEASFVVETLEIVFLVDIKKLADFKIPQSKVTGTGLLIEFGWEKGKELEYVKTLGINSATSF